jgi:hypothetical protein
MFYRTAQAGGIRELGWDERGNFESQIIDQVFNMADLMLPQVIPIGVGTSTPDINRIKPGDCCPPNGIFQGIVKIQKGRKAGPQGDTSSNTFHKLAVFIFHP